jgi:hypothetical protein
VSGNAVGLRVSDQHRHVLIVCSCGTVMYDCGCRLRLVERRLAACAECNPQGDYREVGEATEEWALRCELHPDKLWPHGYCPGDASDYGCPGPGVAEVGRD